MKHEKVVAPDAHALFGAVEPRIVEAEPRRPFRDPGEGLDEVVCVCTGLLGIFRVDNAGSRSIVALRYPNEAILAGGRARSLGIEAIVKSSVAVAALAAVGTVNCLLITQHNEAIAHEWLFRQHLDAEARVAHLLCETAIRGGQGTRGMVNPFTQAQIGEITGQTSVNVNRVFADLERQKLIERKGREITFLDWFELARLGSFRPDYLNV